MLTRPLLAIAIVTATLLNGCSYLKYPDIHKVTIQQGNIITQDMVDQLQPGMTRSQVRYIFGTPMLMDTFDQNRWDYYYGVKRAGRDEMRERITIFFDGDTISHFSGDYKPNSIAKPAEEESTVTTDTDAAIEAQAIPPTPVLETEEPQVLPNE